MKDQQFDAWTGTPNTRKTRVKPTVYQLLGLRDFESEPTKVEAAFAMLSQELEEAKAIFSSEEAKKEYDEHLVRTGYVGLPRLGFWGGFAIFSSFVLSILIVIVSTFYIYPTIVPQIPEPIGDSVTTLAGYSDAKSEKQWNEFKAKQQNIMTMDVNIDIPIKVDNEFDDTLVEPESALESTNDTSSTNPEQTQPVTQPAVEQSTVPEQPATPEQPAVPEQPTVEQPAVPEQPVAEQPAVPEQSAVEQPTVTEVPTPLTENTPASESLVSEPSAEPGLLEVPSVPVESIPAEPEVKPEVPTSEQLSVPSSENSAPQSVGTQPLTSPKQLPSSVVSSIVELTKNVQTKQQYEQLLQSALEAENNLLKDKEFVHAEQIADIVHKACLAPEGKSFRVEALRQKERLTQLTKQWIAVSTAQVRFAQAEDKTQPNADADLIAAWVIDVDNNWDIGLEYLLVSIDEHIRVAAQKDKSTDLSKVDSCIATADAWWNVSLVPSTLQKSFRNRACYWYSKALPSVVDKNTKMLIEKRLSMTK